MKNKLFILLGLSLLFTSCSKSHSSINSAAGNYIQETKASSMLKTSKKMALTESAVESPAVYQDMMDTDYYAEAEEAVIYGSENFNYEQNKKLIKNGFINLSIDSLEDFETKVQNYAALYNGYITNTFMSENSYSAEIKVPGKNFENAMNNAGTLGDIKSRSQNANDVTDEYYDLESRINSKKILRDKLESYLKKAETVKDLMSIEKELNMVISDLEAMEGRMKRLSYEVDYSTINISAYLPTGYTDTGFKWPDFGDYFEKLGFNTVNFLAGFFVVILYIIIYAVPIIILVGFLYWLLFGRIGLLIKLFKFLSKKKDK